jgi:hypothetical protein
MLRRTAIRLRADAGAPPGEPDPATVAVVAPGSGWLAFLGLAPGAALAALLTVLDVESPVLLVAVLVACVGGIVLAQGVVERRWARIWRDLVGHEVPSTLVVGLTADHVALWTAPRPAAPEWRTELVLDRAGTRIRPTLGGLGPYLLSTPAGRVVHLDGDGPNRQALAHLAAALDR